jgi:hypothetical protein
LALSDPGEEGGKEKLDKRMLIKMMNIKINAEKVAVEA